MLAHHFHHAIDALLRPVVAAGPRIAAHGVEFGTAYPLPELQGVEKEINQKSITNGQ